MKKYLLILVTMLLVACAAVGQASKIKASNGTYSLAILPVVDISGIKPNLMRASNNAIKDAIEKKYPRKCQVKILDKDKVDEVMNTYPFENKEAPTLDEMVRVGQTLGVDRVMYIGIMAANEKESRVMMVVGTGTVKSRVTMKLKMVDVNAGKYLFNDNTVANGSSSSVNFWRIGAPSKKRAVKHGVAEAMEVFLTSFD